MLAQFPPNLRYQAQLSCVCATILKVSRASSVQYEDQIDCYPPPQSRVSEETSTLFDFRAGRQGGGLRTSNGCQVQNNWYIDQRTPSQITMCRWSLAADLMQTLVARRCCEIGKMWQSLVDAVMSCNWREWNLIWWYDFWFSRIFKSFCYKFLQTKNCKSIKQVPQTAIKHSTNPFRSKYLCFLHHQIGSKVKSEIATTWAKGTVCFLFIPKVTLSANPSPFPSQERGNIVPANPVIYPFQLPQLPRLHSFTKVKMGLQYVSDADLVSYLKSVIWCAIGGRLIIVFNFPFPLALLVLEEGALELE